MTGRATATEAGTPQSATALGNGATGHAAEPRERGDTADPAARGDTADTAGAAGTADAAWRSSGLAALSGPPPGGRVAAPPGLLRGVADLGRRITSASAALGTPVHHDWPALLTERARLQGLVAHGQTSCGGSTHLFACRDGWLAVSLGRTDDVDLLPAWLALAAAPDAPPAASTRIDGTTDGLATALADAVSELPGAALVEAATLLGLPVGLTGERAADEHRGVRVSPGSAVRTAAARRPPQVVDLGALWAAPRCAALLADAGAEVVKVESADRPDRLRVGSPALFERLNHAKRAVSVDLRRAAGRAELARLVADADVVVTSARARALDQLGLLGGPGTRAVWVSITGHGLASNRVAFGDDAAVAGGLVTWADGNPWFCGDAIADPLAGLAGAAAALELLADGRAGVVDVAMAGVAAAHV